MHTLMVSRLFSLTRSRVGLLLAGLSLAFAAYGQSATVAPPTFTWATAYNVVARSGGGSGLWGHPSATVAATGDVWINVPDSLATFLYGGLGRQRLERRRPDGSLVTSQIIAGRSYLTQVRAAPNGRLYLLGHFLSLVAFDAQHTLTDPDPFPLAHDFLACLDSTGAVRYVRDLTVAFNEPFCNTRTLVPAPADQLYLGMSGTARGTLVHQLDAQGQVVRTLTQTGGMSVDGLDLDASGTLFVTGTCMRPQGGSFNGTPIVPGVSGNGYNQYVACYEPTGTLRWVQFIGDFTCVDPQVRADGTGGVYWLTTLTGPATLGGVTLPGPATGGSNDFMLARLNAAGTVQWAHDVPTGQNAGAHMGQDFCLDTDAAGNVYLAGVTQGTIQWAPGVQTATGNYQELLVQRRSPATGATKWARSAPASDYTVGGGTVAVAPDGTVLVTGTGTGTMTFDALTMPPVTRDHFFVARLTQAGSPTATAGPQPAPAWSLTPNPATAGVTVRPPADAGVVAAGLFDALGRCVARVSGQTEVLTFDVRTLPVGLYVVRATSARGAWTGRIVKE